MQDLNSIGKRLKMLRGSKGINQQQIADYLNVKRQTYSSYENDTSAPSIEILRKLSIYLEASSDFIIGLSDDQSPINVYSANNIQGSNFVQGSGSVTVGENDITSKEESELLRIYQELDVRSRAKLINTAFELEDEEKNKKEN